MADMPRANGAAGELNGATVDRDKARTRLAAAAQTNTSIRRSLSCTTFVVQCKVRTATDTKSVRKYAAAMTRTVLDTVTHHSQMRLAEQGPKDVGGKVRVVA